VRYIAGGAEESPGNFNHYCDVLEPATYGLDVKSVTGWDVHSITGRKDKEEGK
jgi:hypothetical protein